MMASGSPPVVLDTGVVSFIYNGDGRGQFYEDRITGMRPVISFQTLEELYLWPIKNNWGNRRRNELQRHLDLYEVVWPNLELVRLSAELRAEREKAGRRLNTADAWIAATALMIGCPLAYHDGDFDGIPGLDVIKPR
jgi:tRNA(fMet)-specific endonuclease VapC